MKLHVTRDTISDVLMDDLVDILRLKNHVRTPSSYLKGSFPNIVMYPNEPDYYISLVLISNLDSVIFGRPWFVQTT